MKQFNSILLFESVKISVIWKTTFLQTHIENFKFKSETSGSEYSRPTTLMQLQSSTSKQQKSIINLTIEKVIRHFIQIWTKSIKGKSIKSYLKGYLMIKLLENTFFFYNNIYIQWTHLNLYITKFFHTID